MTRRVGVFEALEERFNAYQYGGEEAAVAIRKNQEERRGNAVVHDGHSWPEPQRYLFDAPDTESAAEATS